MKRIALVPLSLAAALALAACGSNAGSTSSADPTASADVGQASAVTPVDASTLAAARKEGEVLLYTNSEEQQMTPVIKAFEAANPGIRVRSLTLGNQEMFQRYQTEVASGGSTADVVMSSDAVGWLLFMRSGGVLNYRDPNSPNLPDYALLGPGVYAFSEDPVIAVFNKAVLPEDKQPTTMADLAKMAPQLDGKIGATAISNVIQFGATSAYLQKYGDTGWKTLEQIGAHAGLESDNGPLVTKLAQGQYAAAFFVSGTVRAFIVDDVAKVVNYRYLKDGTPLLPRAAAVTSAAKHPNAAKVWLNWLLSVPGQEAACTGGFTPYRDGVKCDFGLPQVKAIVGDQNLIIGTFDAKLATEQPQIVARFNKAFGR
ncbi:ABC transporter substrate-binding protein [Cryptosporangium phraense]|uniref:Extracellular solute-binding protein n=1 Tax=Cryptosporangium phraense TaxID=2593070 RepID=A0A545AGG2_9ACTN|nr:extracellular solute-binding protein [Cryptosporangium phraense]TQS40426.1 extracellular solute-binding protein [Cryptosporangium phraense]